MRSSNFRTNETLRQLMDACEGLWERKGYTALPPTLALGIAEEAGEIAQAVLITQCPDYKPSPRKLTPEFADARDVAGEVGDLIVYALHLCNRLGIEPRFDKLREIE